MVVTLARPGPPRQRRTVPSYEQLRELLEPASTVLLTVECQQGVVGPDSALPELAREARSSGALANVARLVAAPPECGTQAPPPTPGPPPAARGATATPASSAPPNACPSSSCPAPRRCASPPRSRSPRPTSSYGGCTDCPRSRAPTSTRCCATWAAAHWS